jgi:hypothetical protein
VTRSGTSAAELEQDVQRRAGLGGNPERGSAAGVSRLQRRPDVKRGEVHGSVQRAPHHDAVGAHVPGHGAVPVQHPAGGRRQEQSREGAERRFALVRRGQTAHPAWNVQSQNRLSEPCARSPNARLGHRTGACAAGAAVLELAHGRRPDWMTKAGPPIGVDPSIVVDSEHLKKQRED